MGSPAYEGCSKLFGVFGCPWFSNAGTFFLDDNESFALRFHTLATSLQTHQIY
jgi:hypothetical protein